MKFERQYTFDLTEIENDISELSCYFTFENAEVFTQEKKLIFKEKVESDEIKTFDRLEEVAAKTRPKLIALLDVISFLTGSSITTYDVSSSSFGPVDDEMLPISKEINFFYEGVDITNNLIKILDFLTKDKFLIASILDKWNKANYLLQSDDSSVLLVDEAILNYFHIFELLSDTVKKDYELRIENELNILLKNFLNKISFDTDEVINSKIQEKKKVTREILVGSFLPFKDKFKFFLETTELFDENTSFFVDNLIKLRNSIAHGRMVYNMDIMAYPLPPFYNTSFKDRELVTPLTILAAVSISKYIGINSWLYEWEKVKLLLQPSDTVIKKYLNNDLPGFNINTVNEFNISWYSLYRFYIRCNNNMKINIEKKVKQELTIIPFEELLIENIYDLAIILCTTQDKELFSIIRKIIKIAIEQNKYLYGNYKDIFYYLESINFNTKKIQEVVKDIMS